MHKNALSLGLPALMLLLMPMVGFAAGNAIQEIATAATHAQMAANAADTATAIMHFHHVINCLVGTKSKQFDADAGNPCNGMGNGALNDVAQKSKEHAKLQHALALAEQALHADKLETTQNYAARISGELKSVNTGE
ncbi:MAG TPA: hypothetical protein VNF48_07320 [Gammaproteobacteria bacterium]|nr:hypothetical protein [Gammaproteobacteria bacterium]